MNYHQTNNAPIERRYESFKQTLIRTSIGKSSLRRLINEGLIVAIKFGTRTLIEVRSVDAFLDTLPRISKRATSEGGEA